MMRKLGLNRRAGGAKAVLPPMVPGSGGVEQEPLYSTAQEMMYGGSTDAYPEYPDSVNSGEIYSTAGELYSNGYGCTNQEDGCLDKSYESSLSEGLYSSCTDPSAQAPIYGKVLPRSLRTFHSDSGAMRPTDFKEPFPPVISRSMSTSTPSPSLLGHNMSANHPPTELSPSAAPQRGSRNSVASSSDSGWASAPLNPSASSAGFNTRASNTSLNSDRTNNSVEDNGGSHYKAASSSSAATLAAQKQQRRLSSISSTGSIGMNTTFTYGAQINSRQDASRQSMRTFGSQESVGSQKSRKLSSVSLSSRNSSNGSLSTSSVSSLFRNTDGVSTLDYAAMIREGISWEEVMNSWLSMLRFSEYYSLFITAGYDLQTVSRMTPEDFTAIGIKKPNHRKKLKAAAEELTIGDGLPDYVPASVQEFMAFLRLQEYVPTLAKQGYQRVDELLKISIEDLEDIGFYRLGHQKRLLLGIKKVRELKKLGQVPRQFQLGGGGSDGSFNNQQHQGAVGNGAAPGPAGYVISPGGKSLQYYPEQLPYQSLPPVPPHQSQHRFSSFHHETPPLITEGEVWRSREDGEGTLRARNYGANFSQQQQGLPNQRQQQQGLPTQRQQQQLSNQRRFERSQSEDHRPSIWQKFKSFEDGDLPAMRRATVSGGQGQPMQGHGQQHQGHGQGHQSHHQGHPQQHQGHQPEVRSAGVEARICQVEQRPFPPQQQTCGTLPRPQATVKPLTINAQSRFSGGIQNDESYMNYPQKPVFNGSCGTTVHKYSGGTEVVTAVDVHHNGAQQHYYQQQQQQHQVENFRLPEVKKPDFSSLEDEGLNSEGDILLPFANDRGGTIKYKTNPALAYQQLQREENEESEHMVSPPPQTPPISGECLSPEFPAPPTGEELNLAMAGYSYNPLDINSQTPGPPPPPDSPSLSPPPAPTPTNQQNPTINMSPPNNQSMNDSGAISPPQNSSALARNSSLLYTPTRKPNRSAGDVLQDIGTMLADLTDELDNMLSK